MRNPKILKYLIKMLVNGIFYFCQDDSVLKVAEFEEESSDKTRLEQDFRGANIKAIFHKKFKKQILKEVKIAKMKNDKNQEKEYKKMFTEFIKRSPSMSFTECGKFYLENMTKERKEWFQVRDEFYQTYGTKIVNEFNFLNHTQMALVNR